MKVELILSKFLLHGKRGIAQRVASMPSSSRELKIEGKKKGGGSPRSKSLPPLPPPFSPSSPSSPSKSRRGRRPVEDIIDTQSNDSNNSSVSNVSSHESKGYQFEYESPTESMSSLSTFPADRNNSTSDNRSPSKRDKDRLKDVSKRSRTTSTRTASGLLSSEDGTMIEVAKITALVEEELKSQRAKHKDQLNRTVAKFKDRKEKLQNEIEQIRLERDDARRELEKCKRSHATQKRAAERNNRLQSEQQSRIESLEEQKALFEELEEERDALLEEVSRSQQQQQKTKEELSALKVRVREDSQKRLSVMECLSTSWDAEKREAKQKEALLNTELDIMSKTLKTEQEFLKSKTKEFAQLEAQHRSTKAELRSIKMTMTAKKEETEEELRRERESRKRLSEEHKHILKLKNDEIHMAETAIRTMKAELKSTREKFTMKEESMARYMEDVNKTNGNNEAADPELSTLREENGRLNAEVKELQKQVESYLANMALQQEFCNSLKSRIYKEQENEQDQVEEIHKLRKRIKKYQKESAAKDLQIDQLKQLLGESPGSPIKVQSKSARDVIGGKKSSMKKSPRKGGYRSS